MKNHYITFAVASVSDNTNSFGLRGIILISRTGVAYEVGASYLNAPAKGARLRLPVSKGRNITFAGRGFEIPRRLSPNAPREVVREVFAA